MESSTPPQPGTKDVPGQLEQTESRAVKKRADGTLLVKTVACRKIQNIDAAELAVRRPLHVLLDGGRDSGVSRLPQGREQSLRFGHRRSLPESRCGLTRSQRRFAGASAAPVPAFFARSTTYPVLGSEY